MSNEMTFQDKVFSDCVGFFGMEKATRIYADAMLLAEKKGKEIAEAVRIVVGTVKKIRGQAVKAISFDKALDVYEEQEAEGRHYSVESALARDVRRIEAYNQTEKAESEKVALVIEQIKTAQAEQDARPDVVLQAKAWIAEYMANLAPAKGAFLASVMDRYAKGEPLGWKDQNRLRMSYAPRGIGYQDFLEVIYRYTVAA